MLQNLGVGAYVRWADARYFTVCALMVQEDIRTGQVTKLRMLLKTKEQHNDEVQNFSWVICLSGMGSSRLHNGEERSCEKQHV